jgi:hypothetical protein
MGADPLRDADQLYEKTLWTPDEARTEDVARIESFFDLAHWHGVGVSELFLPIRRALLGPGIRQSFSRPRFSHLRL